MTNILVQLVLLALLPPPPDDKHYFHEYYYLALTVTPQLESDIRNNHIRLGVLIEAGLPKSKIVKR